MIKKTAITLLFTVLCILAWSQNADSLKALLKTNIHDSTKCSILNLLIETAGDDKIWPPYNDQLFEISEKLVKNCDPNDPQRKLYLKYLGNAYSNTGYLADNNGDVKKAMDNYSKSLKIQEEIGDKWGMAVTLVNIGFVHEYQSDLKSALGYYSKSLNYFEEMKDSVGIFKVLSSLGSIYFKLGDTARAVHDFMRSKEIAEILNVRSGVAATYNNLGAINLERNVKMAEEYYAKSLAIYEELKDKQGISKVLINLAGVKLKLGDLKLAREYAERGVQLAKENGYPLNLLNASKKLSTIYAGMNNYKGAYEMQLLYKQMSDSLLSQDNRKASLQREFQFAYEKKAAADSVRTVEERKTHAAELKQEQTRRYSLYGGLVLLLAFLGFMISRFRVSQKQKTIIEQQKHIVEEKQKAIIDSITYAQRIQRALITSEKYIDKNLNKLQDKD